MSRKEVIRRYYLKNRDKILAKQASNKQRKAEYDRQYRLKNADKLSVRNTAYRISEEAKRKKSEYDRQYRTRSYVLERDRIRSRKKRLANRPLMCHYATERRARVLRAVPPWLSADQRQSIRQFYENRPDEHHVDHIVPLKGFTPGTRKHVVCGLHVPWNLQYLPGPDNIRKSGKWVN